MAEGKAGKQAGAESSESPPITIKKYANRRLYNTATSSYVTLDHLCQMVKDGLDFIVYDAKSGEDITRSVLTQIIVEEEGKGENLLPIGFLRQLIGFYGDNMQRMVLPRYLEYSMKTFARNQEQMQHYMKEAFGGMFPFGSFEEMGKQNLAMFEKAMRMFTRMPEDRNHDATDVEAAPVPDGSELESLQRRMDELQRQLDRMSRDSKKA